MSNSALTASGRRFKDAVYERFSRVGKAVSALKRLDLLDRLSRASQRSSRSRGNAIGDITAVAIPGRWKPDVPLMLPKAGVFAHAEALVVAHRIAAEIAGLAVTDTFCGDGFCMLEAGEDLAGIAFGDFFGEPSPHVEVRSIGKAWHLGKVLFESWWLAPWGMRRRVLASALKLGSRMYGIPMTL